MSTDAPTAGLLVVDAPPAVQAWADALVRWARQGGPDWPGPAHDAVPTRVVTLARLWQLVDEQFLLDGRQWSIARYGLPRISLDGQTFGGEHDPDVPPEPDSHPGWHNVLHACLGNFHS